MFICPQCNIDVADPEYVKPPRKWWQRRRLLARRRIPVCPSGHKLRTDLGDLTELPLLLAFFRGFTVSTLTLLLGVLKDVRFARTQTPHFALMFMTAAMLVMGLLAFSRAWTWAGVNGPAHRLTTRACGVALGYLIPAVASCHALYFHWADAVEAACRFP